MEVVSEVQSVETEMKKEKSKKKKKAADVSGLDIGHCCAVNRALCRKLL